MGPGVWLRLLWRSWSGCQSNQSRRDGSKRSGSSRRELLDEEYIQLQQSKSQQQKLTLQEVRDLERDRMRAKPMRGIEALLVLVQL
jgi:hypothetical protein